MKSSTAKSERKPRDNSYLSFPLSPNTIVRKADGPRVFGLRPTAIDDAIAEGRIPPPMRLTLGGRACGWTGAQILEHRHKLLEQAERDAAERAAQRTRKATAKAKAGASQ